jgi:hypothetical protein
MKRALAIPVGSGYQLRRRLSPYSFQGCQLQVSDFKMIGDSCRLKGHKFMCNIQWISLCPSMALHESIARRNQSTYR